MPSALGGQGISAAMAGYSNRNAMLADAIRQTAQNQQFWSQIQEQRNAEKRQRKFQEDQQKKAKKEADQQKMISAGIGVAAGAAGGLLLAPAAAGAGLLGAGAGAAPTTLGYVGMGLGGAALGGGLGYATGNPTAGPQMMASTVGTAASMQNQQQQLGMQQQGLDMRRDDYTDMAANRKWSNQIKEDAAIAKTNAAANPKGGNGIISTGNLNTVSQLAGGIIPTTPENKQVAEWTLGYALQNIKNQQAGIRDTIGGPPPPDYGTGELGASVRDAVPFQQPQVPLGDRLNWRPRDQYGEWTGEPGTPQLGASPQQAPMTEDEKIIEEIKRRKLGSPSANPYGYRPRF